jgi:TonB family protein
MPNSSLRLIAAAAVALVLPLVAQEPKPPANSQPKIVTKVEPQYSEEAQRDKIEGTVTLKVVVDTEGHPKDIRVTKSLGHGLDQKAIEAVEKWVFRPGLKNGQPVEVFASLEVPFHLR